MKQNQHLKGIDSSIRNKFNRYINKLKLMIIEKMTIGKDIEEFRETALKMAQEEVLEEFDRKYTTEHKLAPPESLGGHIDRKNPNYKAFIKQHKEEYDDMVRIAYKRYLNEMRRMWYFKNIGKLIPQDDENSHNADEK